MGCSESRLKFDREPLRGLGLVNPALLFQQIAKKVVEPAILAIGLEKAFGNLFQPARNGVSKAVAFEFDVTEALSAG
jgi:hypothetical protein